VTKKSLLLILLIASLWVRPLSAEEPDAAATTTAGEARTNAKTGRAFIEMGINWTIGAVNYWNKYAKFIEDWQFTLTWKDQKRKFFSSEGLRLDSNNMRLNWTHAWSGAVYYSWARTNGLSPLASFGFSSGGSLLWEYVAEWREISSINDHVFTWMGGLAIGEPLYQIASHFRRRPGLANRIAETLINPPLGINDFLDGKGRPPRRPLADAADFRFSLGGKQGPAAAVDGASSHAAVDLDLRLVTLPGYGRPGFAAGYSRRPLDSEYRIAASFNDRGVEEFAASTRTVLAGWWGRDVRVAATGGLVGSEWWLGWVSAWDFFQKQPVADYDGNDLGMTDPWFQREQPTRYVDKRSTMHLIGPVLDWTGYSGPLRVRAALEASLDFAMINSLPYNDYSADHDVWGVKTTLHNWGYYYSLGYTVGGRLDLRRAPFRLEAGLRFQRFHSIQGLDRFQGDLIDDSRLRDALLSYHAGLQYDLARTPLFCALNLEAFDRWGRFHETSAYRHELRFFYRLGVTF
jgi:hypothetical protein